VPPPQFDVNIGLTSYAPPTVTRVNAYEDGIDITFDKYMMLSSLNTTNITVNKDGNLVSGQIVLLNPEANPETSETYASKIRFMPYVPFGGGDVILLTISHGVLSYATISMAEDFTASETVKAEPKSITVGDLALIYGETGYLTVKVDPKEAASGKKLTINVVTPSLVAAAAEVLINSDGSADVPITAKLPGKAFFTLTLDGTDLSVSATVDIEMPSVAIPVEKASAPVVNPPGGVVVKGTAVTLTTATEGAMIHYTIDGTEPSLSTPSLCTQS
jgi:hypothetical protein